MIIPTAIAAASQALKSIQVELALKTRQLAQLEETRKEVDKFLGLVDEKAPSMGLPRNNVLHTLSSRGFEHVMELEGKGRGDTSADGAIVDVVHFIVIRMIMIVVDDGNMKMLGLGGTTGLGTSLGGR